MKISKIGSIIAGMAILSAGLITAPVQANAAVDVYTTPGKHSSGGREWSTSCEKYSSSVTRCKTDIFATQVTEVRGKFVSKNGWVFNNLTYKPSDRGQWKSNPLGYPGSWTSSDGRKWKTECDNPTTGRNGCRSYIWSNVIELDSKKNYKRQYKWVFNNIVQFNPGSSGGSSLPTPSKKMTPVAFGKYLASAAQQNQRSTGIPASVAIGMAALETGWGGSGMAQAPINSYFSIKCGNNYTPHSNRCVSVPSYEYRADGTRYLKNSLFRAYDSVQDSILDYGRLLTTAPRYSPAFKHKNNPDEFVRAVRKAGYATDPAYAETVIGIMKRYNFYQYDL